ncbi:MAG: hypothetical protein HIU89_02170 [Proteobacteria bacterium]|nr:hypothetical protein [Pseudomonadota bacterium]
MPRSGWLRLTHEAFVLKEVASLLATLWSFSSLAPCLLRELGPSDPVAVTQPARWVGWRY